MKYQKLNWPLMHNNITEDDRNELIRFIKTDPILTNGPKVREFEEAWSKWLGVKYSVFVNSGASANLLTMTYLAIENGGEPAEVVVPTLTWVSDIASVIQSGLTPRFVDIDPETLGMHPGQTNAAISDKTHAVFLTHVLGIPTRIRGCPNLIEDCCESHGATVDGKKVGTFGRISNFSFYFAHHMTTIEGGMVCTNEEQVYETVRALRSHGMVREMRNKKMKEEIIANFPDVHPSFMFIFPGYNMRSNELSAVLGLNQLKRLDENNEKRKRNFNIFLNELNHRIYRTGDLLTTGQCAYGLIPILREPDLKLRDKIERLFELCGVEFRRGLSGGGNQLRQPYLKSVKWDKKDFSEVEHITDFSWYIGNFPDLDHKNIRAICKLLNQF